MALAALVPTHREKLVESRVSGHLLHLLLIELVAAVLGVEHVSLGFACLQGLEPDQPKVAAQADAAVQVKGKLPGTD